MDPVQREHEEILRDFLKLNGTGAIAVLAFAPKTQTQGLVQIGGIIFVVGLLDALLHLYFSFKGKKFEESESRIVLGSICILFAAAVCMCCLGLTASYFSQPHKYEGVDATNR